MAKRKRLGRYIIQHCRKFRGQWTRWTQLNRWHADPSAFMQSCVESSQLKLTPERKIRVRHVQPGRRPRTIREWHISSRFK